MDDHFRIELVREGTTAIVRIGGELDVASAPELERELEALPADELEVLVLDLRKLEFLDSTGLRAVLTADERARDQGLRFGLVRGPEQVQRLLALTRVAERLHIVAAPEELLA